MVTTPVCVCPVCCFNTDGGDAEDALCSGESNTVRLFRDFIAN